MYLLARKVTFTTRTVSEGYTEFALEAHHTVDTLPEKLDFKQGAAISISCFTAYQALLHSVCVKAGESVLGQVEELEEQHATWLELMA